MIYVVIKFNGFAQFKQPRNDFYSTCIYLRAGFLNPHEKFDFGEFYIGLKKIKHLSKPKHLTFMYHILRMKKKAPRQRIKSTIYGMCT